MFQVAIFHKFFTVLLKYSLSVHDLTKFHLKLVREVNSAFIHSILNAWLIILIMKQLLHTGSHTEGFVQNCK